MLKYKNTTYQKLKALLEKERSEFLEIAKAVIQETDKIEESWSGSWIGYHANLYFGNFEKPGLREMFDSEWGGVHGFDDKWQPRSLEEIWKKIRSSSSRDFDIDEINDRVKHLQKASEEFKT